LALGKKARYVAGKKVVSVNNDIIKKNPQIDDDAIELCLVV
jgi:hypothetical protein